MKKKILFMIINMNVGGTEKALLNMITQMNEDEFDITILMLEKSGGFLSSIPSSVHIEYLREYKKLKSVLNLPPRIVAAKRFKEGHIIKGFNLLFIHFLSKIIRSKTIFFKYVLKGIPNFESEYDIAVAYAGPMDFISYFVAHKIKSKRKIQWIHFDVTRIGFDKKFAVKVYKRFEKIFVVSDEGRKKLISLAPIVEDKTEVFLNVISHEVILEQSKKNKGFKDGFDGIRILTVGRLTSEKGQDLAIKALVKLINAGYNVKWYCLGEGSTRVEYERLVVEYNLEEHFILLGSDPNPYPYMNECDIYVQPSRHEGYCITLAEAKCFNKPIVTTNFTGAKEQINNDVTGLIVSIDEEEIFKAIKLLLEDRMLYVKLKENLFKENSGKTNKTSIKNYFVYTN
ncbi:glycosyltransferase [Peribacillus sp. FSL H8-0477]|uniref:glycosyltransferase n=1 Tax=Peribacillus sp. FSL H8-0477 TaxID=2921388 RepID=UPI0030F949A9